MKTTLLLSALGLSLALNVALGIGHLRARSSSATIARGIDRDPCLLDRLKLDDGQRLRLREMRRRMHEKRALFFQRSSAIKAGLAEAIGAASSSRTQLDAELARYAENQAAMQRAVAEHLVAVSAMLRPEQRDGFRTLLQSEMFSGIRSPGAGGVAP